MKSLIENIESDVKNDTLNHRQNLKELEEKITSNFDSLNKLNAPIWIVKKITNSIYKRNIAFLNKNNKSSKKRYSEFAINCLYNSRLNKIHEFINHNIQEGLGLDILIDLKMNRSELINQRMVDILSKDDNYDYQKNIYNEYNPILQEELENNSSVKFEDSKVYDLFTKKRNNFTKELNNYLVDLYKIDNTDLGSYRFDRRFLDFNEVRNDDSFEVKCKINITDHDLDLSYESSQ